MLLMMSSYVYLSRRYRVRIKRYRIEPNSCVVTLVYYIIGNVSLCSCLLIGR